MTAQYRIVHFVPQPFLGAKIPVAALVRHGGSTRMVAADRQLDADSVGGVAQAATLRMLLRALEGAGRPLMTCPQAPVPMRFWMSHAPSPTASIPLHG